jgi:hypothetical protein
MDTYDKVTRLLGLVFGEDQRHGDYDVVTDVISGYAEPGYGDETSVVVLGNWNPKRWVREGDAPLTLAENLGPRLFDALTRLGAECEWLDEWYQCQGCYKAVRTQQDSYSWKPSYADLDGEILCHTCLIGMGEDAITSYVNDATKAVTWADGNHLETLRFEEIDEDYASGWYPGQNADPVKILAGILSERPDAEVVFLIDSTGQFDIRFSAYVRDAE